MQSKRKTLMTAAVIALTSAVAAKAAPVFFDIELIATSGTGGTGSFSIDSSVLDTIPATGTFISTGSIDDFSITIGAVTFDTIVNNRFIASNGQVTGVDGLCCSDFTSSTTANATLETNTSGGLPGPWIASVNGASIGSGTTYSISLSSTVAPSPPAVSPSTVPLPAGMPLMLIGLAGLGVATRRRTAV